MADTQKQRSDRYREKHKEKIAAKRNSPEAKEKARKQDEEYRKRVGTHPMNVAGTDPYKKYRASEKFRVTSLNNHLKRKYGITLKEYEEIFELQNGGCVICGSTVANREWKNGRVQRMKLFVDHCHKTGKVRGLLCNTCNVGIAQFKDSVELLIKAAMYLTNSRKEN